jgi:transcriptional regulator with XRE-family HTH domain
MPYPAVELIEAICRIFNIPLSRFFTDLDNDSTVDITPREARLIKIFNEFPEKKSEVVLRILERMLELRLNFIDVNSLTFI